MKILVIENESVIIRLTVARQNSQLMMLTVPNIFGASHEYSDTPHVKLA